MTNILNASENDRLAAKDLESFYGEGYDEQFDPPPSPAYECPICLLILREPVQTTCGHRFCRQCIVKTISGRPKCPIDNADLTLDELYPDNFAKREVLSFKTRCRNFATKACPWWDELRNLETHLLECQFQDVPCPLGCGKITERGALTDHVNGECPKRLVNCQYCGLRTAFCLQEEHHTVCLNVPVECPKECGTSGLTRGDVDAHLVTCDHITVFCPFHSIGCTFQDKRKKLDAHLATDLNSHLVSMCRQFADLVEKVNTRDKSMARLKDPKAVLHKLTTLDAKLVNTEKRISDFNSTARDVLHLQENNHSHSLILEQHMNEKLSRMNERVDYVESALAEARARQWNGLFVWSIGNMDTMLDLAGIEEVPAIHSQPFYTTHPGYKMCLRLNVGGVDTDGGSHIALFVHMMQGEFDALLPWPFTGRFMMTIVDQSDQRDRRNISEVLVASPGLQAFARPATPRNHKGYGYVEMVMHDTLKTRSYIKNGKMVVRVNVIVNSV